jgi:hypothetical protein
MDKVELGAAIERAYGQFDWYAGVTYWQYFSDPKGESILLGAGHLKELCAINKTVYDCFDISPFIQFIVTKSKGLLSLVEGIDE